MPFVRPALSRLHLLASGNQNSQMARSPVASHPDSSGSACTLVPGGTADQFGHRPDQCLSCQVDDQIVLSGGCKYIGRNLSHDSGNREEVKEEVEVKKPVQNELS